MWRPANLLLIPAILLVSCGQNESVPSADGVSQSATATETTASTKFTAGSVYSRAEITAGLPATDRYRYAASAVRWSEFLAPGGTLVVTVHRGEGRPDVAAFWGKVAGGYRLLLRLRASEDSDEAASGFHSFEGFHHSGMLFIRFREGDSGVANSGREHLLAVGPDYRLTPTEFAPQRLARELLEPGESAVDLTYTLEENKASFIFLVAEQGDADCCPTGGRILGTYSFTKVGQGANAKWAVGVENWKRIDRAQTFALPQTITAQLNASYPHWRLHWPLPEYSQRTNRCDPNRVRGDFNGDGSPDYAVLIEEVRPEEQPRPMKLWVFSSRNGALQGAVMMQQHTVDPQMYLCNLERGEEIHDWAKNEVIELEHEGFSVVHDDSTASCGFFHGNELQWVLCAD